MRGAGSRVRCEAETSGRVRLIGVQWRKAPLVLRHHPSVLLAVFVAAVLVGLAAASSPFVRSTAASAALKDKLDEFTPFTTGLQIRSRTFAPPGQGVERLVREADSREAGVERVAARLGFVRPPVTGVVTDPVNASSSNGFAQLRLMARTDALEHVKVLSRSGGNGVWISSLAAEGLDVRAGDTFTLAGLSGRDVRVRVKGIYRALANEPQTTPYWNNFYRDIYPPNFDSPPAPSFVFTDRTELFRLVHALGGAPIESVYEIPVDPRNLTLADARSLTGRFSAVRRTLKSGRTAFAQKLCPPAFRGHVFGGPESGCKVLSSLPAAITVADANVSAVSPAITLLSSVGVGLALVVAAAAGLFAVRRRRVEASLSFSRGESVPAFAGRTALEAFLATVAGGIAGFALAYALTGSFAPRGTVDAATLWAGASHAAVAVAVGLCLLTLSASLAFVRLYDTGVRSRPWLRWLPWELPLLALAVYFLVEVETGGGLTRSGSSGAQHPTLAVFVFPLLFVAALAGLAARSARWLLRRGTQRAQLLPVPLYLALRRLAAARGLLVVLTVVSAVSFGAFFYAETLAASLAVTTDEKAYTGNGSDVQGLVWDSTVLPPRFPYPLTKVEFGSGAGAANSSIGAKVDVLLVDPRTLPAVLRWQRGWGPDPTPLLKALSEAPRVPLPVIVTEGAPEMRALSLQGTRVPIHVLGNVHAFPAMTASPLVITSFDALKDAARAANVLGPLGITRTYIWAKGPPGEVADAVSRSGMDAYFVTTVDTFRQNPDVLLATRTYSYLRTIALAAGVLALIGLLLYLQARQRSQVIASALARRMGFGRLPEALSICLEVAGIVLFAAVVGAGVAIAAAEPIVKQIDPLPDYAPSPVFVVPLTTILLAAAGLVVLAVAAGALTSWLARRADVNEAMRVA